MASGARRSGWRRTAGRLLIAVAVLLAVAIASALLFAPQLETVVTGTAFGSTAPQSPLTGLYVGLTVDSVHVSRTHDPTTRIEALDKTVRDARAAQALYNAAFALPLYPSGNINCPLGADITIHLDFARHGLHVLTITADGCFRVSLGGLGDRLWNASFDQTLSSTLGMSDNALWGGSA